MSDVRKLDNDGLLAGVRHWTKVVDVDAAMMNLKIQLILQSRNLKAKRAEAKNRRTEEQKNRLRPEISY
jgi:hypothetical protein